MISLEPTRALSKSQKDASETKHPSSTTSRPVAPSSTQIMKVRRIPYEEGALGWILETGRQYNHARTRATHNKPSNRRNTLKKIYINSKNRTLLSTSMRGTPTCGEIKPAWVDKWHKGKNNNKKIITKTNSGTNYYLRPNAYQTRPSAMNDSLTPEFPTHPCAPYLAVYAQLYRNHTPRTRKRPTYRDAL